jgi:hypothetical protein
LADALHGHFGDDVPNELFDLLLRQSGACESFGSFNRTRADGVDANPAADEFRG